MYEYKMRIFGSASRHRHRADYKIGEAIEFNGICSNTGLNVNMLIIHGTYIDLEIYGGETNKKKTYSLYKIKGAYTY